MQLINGLHHVTAFAGAPQGNVDFYVGVLGLRLVKKTVNFDRPDVYHLYFGNEAGAPGTIMTSFPQAGTPRGRRGVGQLTYTAFTIPTAALGFWLERLTRLGVAFEGPFERFGGEKYLRLEDPDGLGLELATAPDDPRAPWTDHGRLPAEVAIRGFHTVRLEVADPARTLALLTGPLQHRVVAEAPDHWRLAAGPGGPGHCVDVVARRDGVRGLQGNGTVHHVAFSTDSLDTQAVLREQLVAQGYQVTPVRDRNYFYSIYFHEPGGILFEVATNPPGFAADEAPEHLGEALKLPPQYESYRTQLEAALAPIAAKEYA